MAKVGDVYLEAVNKGKALDVFAAEIRLLMAHIQGYEEQAEVLLKRDDEVKNLDAFWRGFQKLVDCEPVEYIIKEADFLGHKLYVDENVLIPRMETAELVSHISERITKWFDPRNYLVVADIGTGSGAISIALKECFSNWLITATDISEKALEVAKRNFASEGMAIRTLQGNSLEPFIEGKMNLDIIVSNPPYILNKDEVQESVRSFEPETALYLSKEDSVYENIFRDYKKVKKGALLMCFEIGYDLRGYLTDLMEKYLEGYEFEFVQDLNGLDRFLFVYMD